MGWTLKIIAKPSLYERRFLLALHLGAALALVPLEGWWRFPLWMVLAFSYWRHTKPPKPWQIEFDGERWWFQEEKKRFKAQLIKSSWRSPWVMVLHFRLHHTGAFITLPIWRDSLPEEDFRRLLVLLKWHRGNRIS